MCARRAYARGGLRKLTERFRDDNADSGEVSCGWRLQVRLHVVGGGLCAKVRLCVVGVWVGLGESGFDYYHS